LYDYKCGNNIEVGQADFLDMIFVSVHLSVVLRYIYNKLQCTFWKWN